MTGERESVCVCVCVCVGRVRFLFLTHVIFSSSLSIIHSLRRRRKGEPRAFLSVSLTQTHTYSHTLTQLYLSGGGRILAVFNLWVGSGRICHPNVRQIARAQKACVFSSHSQVEITTTSLSKAKEKPKRIKLASLVYKFSIVHLRKVMNSCMRAFVSSSAPPST